MMRRRGSPNEAGSMGAAIVDMLTKLAAISDEDRA
jgi:hypothetical protein